MKYTTRLYAGFASIFLLVTLLVTLIVMMLHNQNQEISNLVEDRYEKIKLLNHIRVNAKGIDKDLNLYIHNKGEQKTNRLQRIREAMMNIDEDLNILNGIIKIQDAKVQLSNINTQIKSYQLTVEQIVNLVTIEDNSRASSLSIAANEQYDQIISTSEKLIAIQERIMEDTLSSTKESYNLYVNISLSIIVLSLLFSLGISRGVIKNIKHRFQSIRDVMNSIQYGSENLPRLKVIAKDEIGEIAYAYNKMAEALEEHERIERLYTEEIEVQNWLSMKLADLSMLSQGAIDLHDLGEKYIEEIVPIVGASHGALYVMNEKEQYLFKLSAYADNMERTLALGKDKIRLGDGLIGQCAKGGKPIHIQNIPPDYLSISSGLGETAPRSILFVPILLDGSTLGVLELATVDEFIELHEKLLFQASGQLGMTIYRINQQMQVRELLGEAQALNEELQAQSEELQIQQEELLAINEELEMLYKNSEQKTKDLEVTKQELEEKTRLVQLSSKYKSEFLANLSHELRTPLNSLLILAQILQENKESNLTTKQKEYASTIFSAGKDLLNLINNILDLAKIESGKVDKQVDDMKIAEILEITRQQFEPLAEQKGITLTISASYDIPAIIRTDENKVFQILKNLLSNAIKFTERGEVTLEVLKEQSEKDGQPHLLFKVSDTGIGISSENIKLIFDAFQQADGTTSRKYGGTGLGLSISKELAHILGGCITVDSVFGEGSVFALSIPIQEGQEVVLDDEVAVSIEQESLFEKRNSHSNEQITDIKEFEGKRILIVDDDMRNIFSLTTALESSGMTVFFAENGLEGIQALENNRKIDIVLMDVMMPEMDGFEAIKRIRKSQQYNEVPIIVLTAKAMMDDRIKCMEAGASAYMTKPIKLDELISTLKEWL